MKNQNLLNVERNVKYAQKKMVYLIEELENKSGKCRQDKNVMQRMLSEVAQLIAVAKSELRFYEKK